MKDDDREGKDVSHDPLSHYLETNPRGRARAEKTHEGEDVSQDNMDNHPESAGSPLSDEDVRLAISQPPNLPARRRIKNAAYVLKRTHPELSALRTQEDRERAYELVDDDYRSGQFLIECLGADQYVEPKISMTLLMLRQKMIEEMQIESAAEFILMDCVFMAQYNSIKLQRMLGDLATQVERELFHDDSLSVSLKNKKGFEVDRFKVEDMLNRASDKLMNLIDRTNQMMTRNLKALQDFQRGSLTIRTDQINIAQNQINQLVKGKRKRGSRGSSEDPPGDSSTNP